MCVCLPAQVYMRATSSPGGAPDSEISLPLWQRKQKAFVGPWPLSWERGRFATRHFLKGDTQFHK